MMSNVSALQLATPGTAEDVVAQAHQMLVRAAACDLATFVSLAFSTVDPGSRYLRNWHVRAIAHHLEKVAAGKCRRLIITMPPRSLKSITASVAFPAWLLGHNPSKKLICVSYAQPLAVKLANDFRAVVDAPWYRAMFPGFGIDPRKNTENELRTTRGGFRLATSTHGQLTGRGGDIIIIDDPLKADDAHSELARQKCAEWVRSTLMSRFDNPSEGAVILVMQRLHVEDLAGFFLETGGWEHLNLPAIAAEDQNVPIGNGKWHFRKEGDLLHPERMGMIELDQLRADLGPLAFSAQYQQSPAPPEGNMVKRAWFGEYDPLLLDRRSLTIVQSWDTAMKGDASCDFSVCTTWGKRGDDFFLIDLFRKKMAYPELLQTAIAAAENFNPQAILVEDAGSGTSLIADLAMRHKRAKPIRASGDKASRLGRISNIIYGGRVHLPKSAPWKEEFLREVVSFPADRHDDQVDSMTQALIWMLDDSQKGRFYIGKMI